MSIVAPAYRSSCVAMSGVLAAFGLRGSHEARSSFLLRGVRGTVGERGSQVGFILAANGVRLACGLGERGSTTKKGKKDEHDGPQKK